MKAAKGGLSVERILRDNRKVIPTPDGEITIRRVTPDKLYAGGITIPFGDLTSEATKDDPQKRMSQEARNEFYRLYLNALLRFGVVSIKIVTGDDEQTDAEKNQVHVCDLKPQTLDTLIGEIEAFSGFADHRQEGDSPRKTPSGSSTNPVEDGKAILPDPVVPSARTPSA